MQWKQAACLSASLKLKQNMHNYFNVHHFGCIKEELLQERYYLEHIQLPFEFARLGII